jgi:hypothetical protein
MPHPHRHPNPDSPGPYLHQIRTREMSQYIWYAKISQQPRHDWKPRQRPASGRRELARGEQKFSCHVQNILRGGFSQPSAHLAGGRALSAHRTIKMIAERVRQHVQAVGTGPMFNVPSAIRRVRRHIAWKVQHHFEIRTTILRSRTGQKFPENAGSLPGSAMSRGEGCAVSIALNHWRPLRGATSKSSVSEHMFSMT